MIIISSVSLYWRFARVIKQVLHLLLVLYEYFAQSLKTRQNGLRGHSTSHPYVVVASSISFLFSKIIHFSFIEHHFGPFSSKSFAGVETRFGYLQLSFLFFLFEEWYFSFFESSRRIVVDWLYILMHLLVVDRLTVKKLHKSTPLDAGPVRLL